MPHELLLHFCLSTISEIQNPKPSRRSHSSVEERAVRVDDSEKKLLEDFLAGKERIAKEARKETAQTRLFE
jgi:hypothetical protein